MLPRRIDRKAFSSSNFMCSCICLLPEVQSLGAARQRAIDSCNWQPTTWILASSILLTKACEKHSRGTIYMGPILPIIYRSDRPSEAHQPVSPHDLTAGIQISFKVILMIPSALPPSLLRCFRGETRFASVPELPHSSFSVLPCRVGLHSESPQAFRHPHRGK